MCHLTRYYPKSQASTGAWHACAMRRRALPKMEELCRDARRIAILENVVNPTNVGSNLPSLRQRWESMQYC